MPLVKDSKTSTLAKVIPAHLNESIRKLLRDVLGQDEIIINSAVVYAVIQSIETLKPREAEVVCRYYGITDQPAPVREIKHTLERGDKRAGPLTENAIYALRKKALRKLRHPRRIERVLRAMQS